MIYRCALTGDNDGTRLCGEYEPDGTVVVPECNTPDYYYNGVIAYMRCIDGSWDYVARCLPGLDNTTVNLNDTDDSVGTKVDLDGNKIDSRFDIVDSNNTNDGSDNNKVNIHGFDKDSHSTTQFDANSTEDEPSSTKYDSNATDVNSINTNNDVNDTKLTRNNTHLVIIYKVNIFIKSTQDYSNPFIITTSIVIAVLLGIIVYNKLRYCMSRGLVSDDKVPVIQEVQGLRYDTTEDEIFWMRTPNKVDFQKY